MITNVIKNPENYAAIYARISSKKENNSIDSQIQLGEETLLKNNLLLYGTYTDHVSGRKTAPHQRDGFKQLLDAAKANCFKTLVIYRLDRLVRSYNHWIEIKNTLEKLGVKIIFSDTNQALPSSSPYRDFLENLTVMVAELEPDTINLRTSTGREVQRKNGIYITKDPPFGYVKNITENSNGKSETTFSKEFIKLAFVNYIFSKFYNLIISNESETEDTVSYVQIYNALQSTIQYIETSLTTTNAISFEALTKDNVYESQLYEELNNYIKNYGIEKVRNEIRSVKHNFLTEENGTSQSTNNIINCLRNTTYAGLMLLKTNHPTKGLHYDGKNPETFEKNLDKSAFIEIKNVEKAVEYNIFKTVYEHITYKQLINEDRSPPYLLKNKIRCSCKQKFSLIDNNFLHCGNPSCRKFIKQDLISFILGEIIIDCFTNAPYSITNLIGNLEKKIKITNDNIKFYELNKFKAVNNYLNIEGTNTIDILKNVNHINTLLETCNTFRNQQSYLVTLNNELTKISTSNDKSNQTSPILDELKNKAINYIFSHEDSFIPVLDEIIKEIKVGVIKNGCKLKGNLKIIYTVTA